MTLLVLGDADKNASHDLIRQRSALPSIGGKETDAWLLIRPTTPQGFP